jgi:putative membrane protein insertion efficiency factor
MNEAGSWRRVAILVGSSPRRVLLGLLWFYQQAISPWRQPSCKFYPSCSQYAVTAVTRHGAVRGSWLAARRLGRCHPWAVGGVDDVPDTPPASSVPTAPHKIRSSAR